MLVKTGGAKNTTIPSKTKDSPKAKQINWWWQFADKKDENQSLFCFMMGTMAETIPVKKVKKGFHRLVAVDTPAKSMVLYCPVMVVSTKEAE